MPTGAIEVAKVRKALADRYRIERVLGEGGMATVYLAEDLKHKRKVAVKVMRPELAATLGVDRFLREIQIAAQLSHPHILPVHDSGEAEGFLYYVMPRVEGESLRERIQRERQLPVDDALRLAREMAEGLGHAHKRGIVHRDIKPANVMLGEGHALVADFGIARAESTHAITATGLAVGTPQYMSPEQAMGEPNLDARSDVYAIGTVLYEMLAGVPPFAGPTPQAVLAKNLTQDLTPLTNVRPGLPVAVTSVVARAMSRNPADRFASGVELEAAIAAAQESTRTSSHPVAASSWSTGQVWGLFGVAAAASLAVIYGLVSRWGLPSWTLWLALGLLVVGAGVLFMTGRVEVARRSGQHPTGIAGLFTWRNATRGGFAAAALWAAVAVFLVFRGPASSGAGEMRLAVLPFENRGDTSVAYFADGITDAVRTKLSSIAGMQVTARFSSAQYRQSSKTPQEIARELGVRYLLTGTVRWQQGDSLSSRVQVNPELIDATTGDVRWSQGFDATITDVFKVQGDVAAQVASALHLALGAEDRTQLLEKPTENLDAYDAYLRGDAINDGHTNNTPTVMRRALREYERAVALDPRFALAWASVSRSYSSLYGSGMVTPEIVAAAQQAADKALALDPQLPESHLAAGHVHSNITVDLAKARSAFSDGLRISPNNAALRRALANNKAATGDFDGALADMRALRVSDPRSPTILRGIANYARLTRRYDEARQAYEQVAALSPGNIVPIHGLITTALGSGDLAEARRVIRERDRGIDRDEFLAYVATYSDLYWVLEPEDLDRVLELSPALYDDNRGYWAINRAQVYALRGDSAKMRAWADTAVRVWGAMIKNAPDDPSLPSYQSIALAFAGRMNEAIRMSEALVAAWPVSRDYLGGPYYIWQLARVYVMAGKHDMAIDRLAELLTYPGDVSAGWLRLEPSFAPLKGNPRFEKLIAGA